MPVTLSKIAGNTASVKFSVGEDSVQVTYYPGRVTEKAFTCVAALQDMDQSTLSAGFSGFNEMLATLIKEWDVYEDAEQTMMFPIDAKRFAELPFQFRMQVFQEIMQDIRPEAVAPQTAS